MNISPKPGYAKVCTSCRAKEILPGGPSEGELGDFNYCAFDGTPQTENVCSTRTKIITLSDSVVDRLNYLVSNPGSPPIFFVSGQIS